MTPRHRTSMRLLVAAPILPLLALGITHFVWHGVSSHGYYRSRVVELWVLGAVWFLVCVGSAVWAWRRD
jgi:hypothetical protein